jgi:hypothetical protein
VSEDVKLDWSSAEVHDGKLVIALEGKLQKGWKDAFERTTRLLNRRKWEEVTLKKRQVLLQPITPGEEDRARHLRNHPRGFRPRDPRGLRAVASVSIR